jgi:hypothetical protein
MTLEELSKSGAANVLTSLHGGLKTLEAQLAQTEDAAEAERLQKERIALYYKKLEEAVIELSSNCAAVTVLVESLVKADREILKLENRTE